MTSCRFPVTRLADDICRGHNIFLMPTVPKLMKLGPNSKQVKCTLDNCA